MPRIGFIGLGRMGIPILSRVHSSSGVFGIYNRTRAKASLFPSIRSYDEPFQMGSACDVILLSLGGDDACESVMFGGKGLDKTLVPGTVVVNLGTVSLGFAQSASRRIAQRGGIYLDAPVIGSVDLALEGKLITLVSGDRESFSRVEPVLKSFSSDVIYLGVTGNAVKMVLINNLVSATNLAVASEAIVAAENAGISKETAMKVMLLGNAHSRVLEMKRKSLSDEQFIPGIELASMMRNLHYGMDMAEKTGTPMPLESAAFQYYLAALSIGLGRLDYSSVLRSFRFLSGKS